MKALCLSFLLFATISNGQEISQMPKLDDALHLKGSKVISVNTSGIKVMYEDGFKTIPLKELSPEVIKFYKLDKSVEQSTDISFGVMGETKDKCISRFGNPIKERGHYTIHGNSLFGLDFSKGGYTFTVGFLNGYASSLKIGKDNNTVLTDDEIQTLLKANSSLPWLVGESYNSTKSWHTPNKSLVALYDPLETEIGEKNLVISTREVLAILK